MDVLWNSCLVSKKARKTSSLYRPQKGRKLGKDYVKGTASIGGGEESPSGPDECFQGKRRVTRGEKDKTTRQNLQNSCDCQTKSRGVKKARGLRGWG